MGAGKSAGTLALEDSGDADVEVPLTSRQLLGGLPSRSWTVRPLAPSSMFPILLLGFVAVCGTLAGTRLLHGPSTSASPSPGGLTPLRHVQRAFSVVSDASPPRVEESEETTPQVPHSQEHDVTA